MKPETPAVLRGSLPRRSIKPGSALSRSDGHTSGIFLPEGRRCGSDPDYESMRRAALEAEKALRRTALATHEAAAQAMLVADVLGEAIAVLGYGAAADGHASNDPGGLVESLSPRQKEVLALVAAGHSNRTIAETLFVSPNTVKTHVASLLAKLHAETRVQLAAIAVRHEVG